MWKASAESCTARSPPICVFLDWVSGQNSDGLGEGFEQRAIRTGDGEMYVHLWNPDDSWFLCREDQLDEHIEHNYGMGGMT